MSITMSDIQQAWRNYVQETMVVTLSSSGVPAGQSELNPKEKVDFDITVTNGTATTGIKVHNVRVHLKPDPDNGVFQFIVPDSSTGVTAFETVDSTSPLLAGVEKREMFIETTDLKALQPGDIAKINGKLQAIAKKVGTSKLATDVHATVEFEQVFAPNMDGKDASVTLTVKT